MKSVKFGYKREAWQNPYTGFVSFQHFGTDVLYSDLVVRPENNMTETEHVECYPVPSYVKEEGKGEGYYPEASMAYIRVLWREFEPKECEYNYTFIEDILKRAREKNQSVMFRIMQHSTREEDDVPDWLREKIECPRRPKSARFKESPSSPLFLEYFERTVRAFAERFDKDPTLAFIDVSLPGAWGEGDSCHLFSEEDLKKLVDTYTESFKNTLIIGQVSPTHLVHYMNETAPVGWRADCIGHPKLLRENVTEAESEMPEIWKRGHVSFESYWWLGEWDRKDWDIDEVIEKTLSWHISSFNAKSLPIPLKWREKVDAWVDKMGYHFKLDEISYPDSAKSGERAAFTVNIDNVGVAPIYHSGHSLYIKLNNGKNYEEIFDTGVDIRSWFPGKSRESFDIALPLEMPKGSYELAIGIGGISPIAFATDAPRDGGFYTIGSIDIK